MTTNPSTYHILDKGGYWGVVSPLNSPLDFLQMLSTLSLACYRRSLGRNLVRCIQPTYPQIRLVNDAIPARPPS